MRSIAWHPEDARWLRRWLRSNLVGVLAIAGFVILLRFPSHRSLELEASADLSWRGERLVAVTDRPFAAPNSTATTENPLPPESELVYLSTRQPNPITPQGWRRTELGWEHVSTWPHRGRPLAEIVMEQQAREPIWMKAALALVRQVPPLAFALLQIAAISAIVAVSRRQTAKSGDVSMPDSDNAE